LPVALRKQAVEQERQVHLPQALRVAMALEAVAEEAAMAAAAVVVTMAAGLGDLQAAVFLQVVAARPIFRDSPAALPLPRRRQTQPSQVALTTLPILSALSTILV
jgi:hypothetical protein